MVDQQIEADDLEISYDQAQRYDPLARYGREARRYPLLEHEEVLALSTQFHATQDFKARERLILHNLRLVIKVARWFKWRGKLEFQDLVQEGNIGLIVAAERYDPTLGNRFSTYAIWWIRQAISRAIANHATLIRRPVHMVDKEKKLRVVASSLKKKLHRDPEVEEVASQLGISVKQANKILDSGRVNAISFEEMVPEGSGPDADLGNFKFMRDPKARDPEKLLSMREAFEQLFAKVNSLKGVTPKNKEIFRVRVGLDGNLDFENPGTHSGKTLEETGRHFGLTRERVRQVVVKVKTALDEATAREERTSRYRLVRAVRPPITPTTPVSNADAPVAPPEPKSASDASIHSQASAAPVSAPPRVRLRQVAPKPSYIPRAPELPNDQSTQHTVQEVPLKETYLEKIVTSIGGEALEDFKALKAAAGRTEAAEAALTDLRERIRKALDGDAPSAPVSAPRVAAAPQPPTEASASKAARRPPVDNAKTSLVARLVQAASKGDEALESEYLAVARELGIHKKDNWRRSIGIMYARSQGKFRRYFVARLLEGMPQGQHDRTLERLADWYSKIEGKTVAVGQLRREASTVLSKA